MSSRRVAGETPDELTAGRAHRNQSQCLGRAGPVRRHPKGDVGYFSSREVLPAIRIKPVGVIKPDPRIFELRIERFAIDPHRAVFIDDVEANAAAARSLGFRAIRFTDATALRAELVSLGLLSGP